MTAQQEEGVLSQSLHRRVPTTSYSQHQHLMHPPLFKPHPDCEELVKALVTCHEQNPTAKFWGACNDPITIRVIHGAPAMIMFNKKHEASRVAPFCHVAL